jgi:selenocysteine-specific elongation factor
MDIIVGTAGHIDHGKTALVKALTGTDADRLPEEKARGITIDLGFAELVLGDVRIGFVDVPGHEKFVKNMLAGASGIDVVALVIAADEGVMPQTREHFEICRLLETKRGIVVLTKCDLVEPEFLELVKLDAAELVENSFLENAPVVEVSAKTGAGIEKLKDILQATTAEIPARKNESVTRLPVDRAFSVKGFGAVVTGTLASGEISAGSDLEFLPTGKKVRVRGLQTHGKDVGKVSAGQRAAVNLGGIDHDRIERGMILSEPGVLRPTQIFDAEVEVLRDAKRSLKSRQRVRVHLGTVEALARIDVLNEKRAIEPGEKDLVQIRLEIPVTAVPGERFILRQYSPQMTVAGGKVIDALAGKYKRKELVEVRRRLNELLAAGDDRTKRIELFLEMSGEHGLNFADLQARTAFRREILQAALDENIETKSVIKAENSYLAAVPFDGLKRKIFTAIEAHHEREPLARGILRETLREKTAAHLSPEVFKTALEALEKEGRIVAPKDFVRAGSHQTELSADEKSVREKLLEFYRKAGLQVAPLEDVLSEAVGGTKVSGTDARKIFQMLVNESEVRKVTEEFYFSRDALEKLIAKIRDYAATEAANRLIGVPEFKDMAGVSRKYAIPLLEYFDREKITRRAGDKRLVL